MPLEEIDTAVLADLLASAHAGCATAWDELIRVCRPLVERHARKHAWSNTDAEDIAQEVWIRLVQHAGRIRDPQALVGWLAVVTRRLAAEVGHRNARAIPTELEEDRDRTSSTEEQALRLHNRRHVATSVRTALERLSASDRELVLMLHEDGAPKYGEISRRVSRPVGSLGPTRRRVLDRLARDPAVRRLEYAVAGA